MLPYRQLYGEMGIRRKEGKGGGTEEIKGEEGRGEMISIFERQVSGDEGDCKHFCKVVTFGALKKESWNSGRRRTVLEETRVMKAEMCWSGEFRVKNCRREFLYNSFGLNHRGIECVKSINGQVFY